MRLELRDVQVELFDVGFEGQYRSVSGRGRGEDVEAPLGTFIRHSRNGKKNGRVDGAVTLRGAGGTHPSVLLPLGGIEHYPGL